MVSFLHGTKGTWAQCQKEQSFLKILNLKAKMLCVKITGSWKRHPDNTFIYMRAGLNIAQRKGETAHHPWKGGLTPSHHYTPSHETLSCGSVVPPRKESLTSHPHTCQNLQKQHRAKAPPRVCWLRDSQKWAEWWEALNTPISQHIFVSTLVFLKTEVLCGSYWKQLSVGASFQSIGHKGAK